MLGYHDALEALDAFDNTKWIYSNANHSSGDYARGGLFDELPKVKDGYLQFGGNREVTFYKNSIEVFRNGAPRTRKSGFTYMALSKGRKGLRQLAAHEGAHTMVSKMFKSNGRQYKQFGRRGFESMADRWAKKVGTYSYE